MLASVTDIPFRKVLGLNQQTYHRLKLALSLNLRRQVFIAVCDDLVLRDRMAAQLQAELSAADEDRHPPHLVSLHLNLNDPNPIDQVNQWLAHADRRSPIPLAFQILGIEQLTRQPAAQQRRFLTYLQSFERSLSNLDTSLLLWMPQPWFRSIPQSAPGFWRCRTGVFEFVGDPTPLPSVPTASKPRLTPVSTPPGQAVDEGWSSAATPAHLSDSDRSKPAPPVQPPPAPPADPVPVAAAPVQEEPQLVTLLHQIDQLHQQQAPPAAIADAYRALGNRYRDRIEQGEVSQQNLTVAIQAYEQVLVWLQEASPLWADVLNDLGNLYWMVSRHTADPEQAVPHLQQAIQVYQLALTKSDPQNQQVHSMLQNNLGAAYADLARYQDPAGNLQRSLQAYQEALHDRQPNVEPLRYASTQNNLGTTYWNLAQHHQPVTNLKQAIAAYSEALRYYTAGQEPLNYAMLQNNLGTAYWNLAQHERPQDWLRLAITAYRKALQYRTLDAAPAAFAATQSNLGTACWHLANHTEPSALRLDYLRQAIAAYNTALKAAEQVSQSLQPVPLTFDRFATHNNLGLAHYQMAIDHASELSADQQNQHLEAALHHHVQAVQGWQQKADLRQTAMSCIVQTVRAFYNRSGLVGQNLVLSKIPGQLLPEILPQI